MVHLFDKLFLAKCFNCPVFSLMPVANFLGIKAHLLNFFFNHVGCAVTQLDTFFVSTQPLGGEKGLGNYCGAKCRNNY